MTTPIPYLIKFSEDSDQIQEITMFLAGKPMIVPSAHINFEKIIAALQVGDAGELQALIDIKQVLGVSKLGGGSVGGINFDTVTGKLTYQGYPVAQMFLERALTLARSGMDAPLQHFLKFLENLYQNPSSNVIGRLYQFLEKGNMPTTDDGHFLAYKKVRADFKDIYTGTIDNSLGVTCKMPRSVVNDDQEQTCSAGLHFCSYDYLSQFGSNSPQHYQIIVVKVNPRDVVSIPTDYNDSKGRCCEYTVTAVLSKALDAPTFTAETTPVEFYRHCEYSDHGGGSCEDVGDVGTHMDVETKLQGLTNSQLTVVYNNLQRTVNGRPPIDHVRSKADAVFKIMKNFDLITVLAAVGSLTIRGTTV